MQQHSFTSLTSRVSNCYIVYNNTYFNINRHADRYADTNTDGFVDILSITNADTRSNADGYTDAIRQFKGGM